MLPSSKNYLIKGGFSAQEAAYILIGCFIAGVVGIQVLSRSLHHYIPSHVVDCDHTHDDKGENDTGNLSDSPDNGYTNKSNGHCSEDTPLLSQEDFGHKSSNNAESRAATVETTQRPDAPVMAPTAARRPSLQTRLTKQVSTFVSGAKSSCDEDGPCYGYGDPCGKECFKAISRSPTRAFSKFANTKLLRQPSLCRRATAPFPQASHAPLQGLDEEDGHNPSPHGPRTQSEDSAIQGSRGRQGHKQNSSFRFCSGKRSSPNGDSERGTRKVGISSSSRANPPNDPAQAHHHHVPTNAFLSIGLQTSIAIALHKLPEGFITYATNHANPKLGFAVFMALFIHNITEGFAMALPLYLALGSRWKAMFWSSLLGGISQPLGAGVAAIWFKVAGRSDMAPGERVYGGMFAVTAGIMTSVALQLFSESLGLTHNRNLCIAFAFVGMSILGVSFALTAD